MKKVLVVGAALGVASTTEAATFTVTTNADDGPGSLRQAIAQANTNAGPDTITFSAALSGSTITLATGEMLISDSVDLQGPGSASLTVDANEASRVFYVYNPSPAPVDVTISGLTLENGFSVIAQDPAASAGGAIRVVGENLALDDVRIENSIAGGDGGGIAFFGIDSLSGYNPVSAALSIERSVISGNAAHHVDLTVPVDQGGCGGGVWAGAVYNLQLDEVTLADNAARCDGGGLFGVYFQEGAQVTIQSSVITGNAAQLGEGGAGGGLAFVGYTYDSSVTIADTTISGNDGGRHGGGIAAQFTLGMDVQRSTISGNTADYAGGIGTVFSFATIENTTVANNTANEYGGAIYGYYSYLTIKESTISGNDAGFDGPGIYAYAGTRIGIVNSIVANNGDADLVDGGDSSFDVAYSLIENEDGAQLNDLGGNIFGQDPQLGLLQDNGGPTLTMQPAPSSPVLDAGDPSFTPPPATDQRGAPRVQGGRIDMGAIESPGATVQFSVAAQNAVENAGAVVVTVTRTGSTNGDVSVFVGVDGSSTATGGGVDYTFPGAAVSFADGDAAPKNVVITIADDLIAEGAETVVLTLSLASGAEIGAPATHTLTIIDNDAASDLSIDKRLEPGPITQGSNVTFTLTATNHGPGSVDQVLISDALPAQLTLVSATPSSGSCSGTTTVVCNVGTLNASQSATVTIVATMTGSGEVTNTATVTPTDANNGNNSDPVTFTILPAAALANVPALDARMQLLLAALVAAAALGILKRST